MKYLLRSHSSGQSLVFVAIISIALFGMLALALDFGYSLYNRRWAQNTADSAALAAARILCTDRSGSRYTNATTEAQSYAETYNRAFGVLSQTMTELCMYGNANNPVGCPTMDKGQAKVTVQLTHPTFVANFFGTNSISVPATATAGCFAPGGAVGAGVIPIAWKCDNITCSNDPVTGEETCTCGGLEYIPTTGSCSRGTDPIYVFFDLDSSNSYYWCTQWGASPQSPDPITGAVAITITCDVGADGNTQNNIFPVSPLNPQHKWFWFDDNGGGCGTSTINGIIQSGIADPMYTHTWYPECTGNRASSYNAMDQYRDNSRVILPVFDRQCQIADPLTNHGSPCNAGVSTGPIPDAATDIKAGAAGNGQTNWYHLSSFTLLDIKCVQDANSDCGNPYARQWLEDNNPNPTKPQQSLVDKNQLSFEGCFVEGFVPGMFGRPSDGVDTGAWTLYLVN